MPKSLADPIHPTRVPISDEQAMWRVQMNDDSEAFGHLVERWEKAILRLCARMTGDQHRAEDLKQEIFARVFARRHDFRAESRFSTWLWRIALNLCYDDLRKMRRRNECQLDSVPELAPPLDPGAPDQHLVEQEENALVRAALLQLPEQQRTMLVLRYCEGLPLREVADIMQIPETTLSYRLALALRQITRILKPGQANPPRL